MWNPLRRSRSGACRCRHPPDCRLGGAPAIPETNAPARRPCRNLRACPPGVENGDRDRPPGSSRAVTSAPRWRSIPTERGAAGSATRGSSRADRSAPAAGISARLGPAASAVLPGAAAAPPAVSPSGKLAMTVRVSGGSSSGIDGGYGPSRQELESPAGPVRDRARRAWRRVAKGAPTVCDRPDRGCRVLGSRGRRHRRHRRHRAAPRRPRR